MTRKRKLLKVLLLVVVLLIVLVVSIGVTVTRPFFIKGVVLPRVASATGIPIELESMAFSPFSEVELRGVRVGAPDQPLLTAKTMRCRYSLSRIIRGDLRVEEVLLEGAKITIVQNADGSLNIPGTAATTPAPAAAPAAPTPVNSKPTGASPPPNIHVTDINVRDLAVTFHKAGTDGQADMHIEIADITVSLPELRNGGTAVLKLGAVLRNTTLPNVDVRSGTIEGTVNVDLSQALMPTRLDARFSLHDLAGTAQGLDLAGRRTDFTATVTGDGTTFQIQELTIEETRGETVEAALVIKGSATVEPLSADLTISVGPVHPDVLNIVGGLAGDFNFGKTTVQYAGRVSLKNGDQISATGDLELRDLTVASTALGLPALTPLSVSVQHDAAVNLSANSVRLSALNIGVNDGDRNVIGVSLSEPLSISLSNKAALDDAVPVVRLNVNALPLAWANPLIPADAGLSVESGTLNVQLTTKVANMGKQVDVSGSIEVNDIGVRSGDMSIRDLAVREDIDLRLSGFTNLTIARVQTQVLAAGKKAVEIVVKGALDLSDISGNVDVVIADVNQDLLAVLPPELLAGVEVQSFRVTGNIAAAIRDAGAGLSAAGTIGVADAVAQLPGFEPTPALNVETSFAAALTKTEATLSKFELNTSTGGKTLANLGLTANAPMPLKSGRISASLTSTGLDLRTAESLLKPVEASTPAEDGTGTQPDTPAPAPGGEDAEPTPSEGRTVDLGGLAATVGLDLKNIMYQDIVISSCTGNVDVTYNVATVKPLDLVINGATLSIEGSVDLAEPGFAYDLKTKLSDLPFAPFIKTFAPDLESALAGGLKTFEATLSGKGTAPADIVKNLAGAVAFSLKELTMSTDKASLQELPVLNLLFIPYKWLDSLSESLQSLAPAQGLAGDVTGLKAKTDERLGKLKHIEFEQGDLRLEAGSGKLTLAKCILDSNLTEALSFSGAVDLAGIGTTGAAGFDPALESFTMDMTIEDVPVAVKLPIGGTLKKPKVDLKGSVRSVFSGVFDAAKKAVKSALGDALKSIMQGEDVDPDALKGNLKKSLEDALKGRAATPAAQGTGDTQTGTEAATPATKEQDAEGSTKDLLRNILGTALKTEAEGKEDAADTATQPGATQAQDAAKTQEAETTEDAVRKLGNSLLRGFRKSREKTDE